MPAAVKLLWSRPSSALIGLANTVSTNPNPSEGSSGKPHPTSTGRAQCTEVTVGISLSALAGMFAACGAGCPATQGFAATVQVSP